MKKALTFCFLLLSGSSLSAVAGDLPQEQLSACMQSLPQTVIISEDKRDLNFSKAQRLDSFYNYEEKEAGAGYRQDYQSNICYAGVYLASHNMGMLSNNKVQRQLREEVAFPRKKHQSFRKHGIRFFGVSGMDTDIANSLIVGDYYNNFLKVRITCPVLPTQSDKEVLRLIDDMSQKIARDVTNELNACLFPAKK